MFKPCPDCGFLVALIAGREASQRCPRCGSAMLEDGELPPAPDTTPARSVESRTAGRRADRTGADVEAGQPLLDDPVADVVDAPQALASPAASRTAADSTDAGAPEGAPGAAEAELETGAPAPAAESPTDSASSAPSFTARRSSARARPTGRRWPWMVALPLLALLLGVQLLLSQRTELAQDATWRPWLTAACNVFGCDVPAWREPSAFAMLARNVRPHATRDGVLHVTTSLRNDAQWPQPLPVVVLSLSDLDGRTLAARAVAPSDYARRTDVLVGPGDSVDIAFDVREPSPRVVSFDFQLR